MPADAPKPPPPPPKPPRTGFCLPKEVKPIAASMSFGMPSSAIAPVREVKGDDSLGRNKKEEEEEEEEEEEGTKKEE